MTSKPELDTPMELDRKALKEAPPMSSIPAAVERLADMAEFFEEATDPFIAESVCKEHAADLRWSLAELSRLREENAKLRAERDEALAVVRQVAALDGTKPPHVAIGRTVREAASLIKGGADDSKPRSVADIVAGWPSCSFCGRIFPQSFAPDCNVPECPSRAALQNKDESNDA